MAIIKNSYALIGGDSAPLHIANAFNIYSIGIFGDTLPLIYGARGEKAFNIEERKKYCNFLKSFHCEYIKRGCKTIDCLNKLKPEEILPYLISIYNN
jgi:heptosyltransferase-2